MTAERFPSPEDFQDPLENYEPKTYEDPLEEALAEETVTAIRHEPYVSIPPEMPIRDAIAKLAGLHVACLLVEKDRKLVGVFSDRDALAKVALEYDRLQDQPVSRVMTSNPIYVYETDCPAAALAVMAVAGYRHVPVLNLEEQLVGIVSPQRVTAFLHTHFRG
ncbi:MAG: CBS domain-containing protein [Planctomycetales bacterium]|nr:CBS domain-containing protein [Planctomycetales bacterium]